MKIKHLKYLKNFNEIVDKFGFEYKTYAVINGVRETSDPNAELVQITFTFPFEYVSKELPENGLWLRAKNIGRLPICFIANTSKSTFVDEQTQFHTLAENYSNDGKGWDYAFEKIVSSMEKQLEHYKKWGLLLTKEQRHVARGLLAGKKFGF